MLTASVLHKTELPDLFSEICHVLFYSQRFVVRQSGDVDFQGIYKKLHSLVKAALNKESKHSVNNDFKDIVYAMVAIIDEIMLNTAWQGKGYWEDNMFEKSFFNTQVAGELIFTIMDDLLTSKNNDSVEKAEIYLKLLALGFKGKYRDTPTSNEEINDYRKRLFDYIERNDRTVVELRHRFFQQEYTHTIPSIHRKLLPDASIMTLLSVFFIFMFLTISTVVWAFQTKDLRALLHEVQTLSIKQQE